ncbi:hypothetical protein Rleg10DRAFT_3637 [Rhizobium leguminosarum bv. trifolii WSM2012]|nr:hypothetical protein Rleg10DRAFT_3637 [Rhizobium leguminosarum bv. trifolii WSM2012]
MNTSAMHRKFSVSQSVKKIGSMGLRKIDPWCLGGWSEEIILTTTGDAPKRRRYTA